MSLLPDCFHFSRFKCCWAIFISWTNWGRSWHRFNELPSFFCRYEKHLCPFLLLWFTPFSSNSLPRSHVLFFFLFTAGYSHPNFLLYTFVPPLIRAITALTQFSALITLVSAFSPLLSLSLSLPSPLAPYFLNFISSKLSSPLSWHFPSYLTLESPSIDDYQAKIHPP